MEWKVQNSPTGGSEVRAVAGVKERRNCFPADLDFDPETSIPLFKREGCGVFLGMEGALDAEVSLVVWRIKGDVAETFQKGKAEEVDGHSLDWQACESELVSV